MAAKLKKGDEVIVLTGKDKGKSGEIVKVFPAKDRIVVSGINKVKRHTKPSAMGQGGIEEKEAAIHISNVAYKTDDGKASRIGFKKLKDGSTARVIKKTKETVSE